MYFRWYVTQGMKDIDIQEACKADFANSTATHCNTLQHTTTTHEHIAIHCNTLQHTATTQGHSARYA